MEDVSIIPYSQHSGESITVGWGVRGGWNSKKEPRDMDLRKSTERAEELLGLRSTTKADKLPPMVQTHPFTGRTLASSHH